MSYQPLSDEHAERVDSVRGMRSGQSAVAAAEALVTEAEHSGDDVFLASALSTLANEFNLAGETHKALVPIARFTQLLDTDPERFDPNLHDEALWFLKFLVSILTDDPANTNEVIERWMGEAERRLTENGYSLRPLYQARMRLDVEQGRYDEAEEMARKMVTAERDGLADCPTCEEFHLGDQKFAAGDVDAALYHWGRVVSGELWGCSWEPARSQSRYLMPAVQSGAVDEAVEAHIVGMSASRREAGAIVDIAHHIEFCALTHNEARGVEIANDYRLDYDASDADRAEYLASIALLARRLVEVGFGEIEVRNIDGTPTPAMQLAGEARAATEELVARFVARDGDEGGRVRRLRQRLDADPITDSQVPLGLSSALAVAAQSPPAPSSEVNPGDAGSAVTAPDPADLVRVARSLSSSAAPGADEAWFRVLAHRTTVDLTDREDIMLDLLTTGIADWDRRRDIAERLDAVGAHAAARRVEAETNDWRWWRTDREGTEEWLRLAAERTRVADAAPDELAEVARTVARLLRTVARIPGGTDGVQERINELVTDLNALDSLPISPYVPTETRLATVQADSEEEYHSFTSGHAEWLIEVAGDDRRLRAEGLRMLFMTAPADDPGDLDERYALVEAEGDPTDRCRLLTELEYFDRLARGGRFPDAARVGRRGLTLAQAARLPDAIELQMVFAARLGRLLSYLDRDLEAVEVLESSVAVLDPTQVNPGTYVNLLETLADVYDATSDNTTEAAEIRVRVAQFVDRFGNLSDRFNAAADAGFGLARDGRFGDARAAFARAEQFAIELDNEISATHARYGAATAIEDLAERASALEELRSQVDPSIEAMRSDGDAFELGQFINWLNIQSGLFRTLADDPDTDVAGRPAAIDEGVALWRTIEEIEPDYIVNVEVTLTRLLWMIIETDRKAEGRELFERLRGAGVEFGPAAEWIEAELAAAD